jgi:hypothetical protein
MWSSVATYNILTSRSRVVVLFIFYLTGIGETLGFPAFNQSKTCLVNALTQIHLDDLLLYLGKIWVLVKDGSSPA